MDDLDKKINACTKAIELNINNAGAYLLRRNSYFKKEYFDKAIQDYNKAIALKPKFEEGYTKRGLAYINKAIFDYTKALELNPENKEAHNSLEVAKLIKSLKNQ
jgi:tetratricopeptide (TPR) repeat protein